MSRSVYFIAGVLVIAVIVLASIYIGARSGGVPTTTVTVPGTTKTVVTTVVTTITKTVTKAPTAAAGEPVELRVYVYEDFMAWGEDPEIFDKLVKEFESETGIRVVVERFKGAKAMVSQVVAEAKAGKPTADVVIGVDSITVQQLESEDLLECYVSPYAAEELVEALDPDKCVTPIDYGLIALVYDPSRLTDEQKAMLSDGVTIDELVELSPVTVGEDPAQSSTGVNYLLYTIAVSRLEGVDWRELWRGMRDKGFYVAGTWGDAYDEFFREGSKRAIVVSYGTDPAYSAWYSASKGGEEKPSVYATVLRLRNGSLVGWVQIEGVAIIKGARLEAAKKFVDWLLSPRVQREIPTSQWMLPANYNVELPSFYKYALTARDVDILLNKLIPRSEVSEKLEEWIAEWIKIMSG